MLLSIVGKILSRVILDRLKGALDAMLKEEQAGFRKGQSCTDQIATLHITEEQSAEWQSSVYICFNLWTLQYSTREDHEPHNKSL